MIKDNKVNKLALRDRNYYKFTKVSACSSRAQKLSKRSDSKSASPVLDLIAGKIPCSLCNLVKTGRIWPWRAITLPSPSESWDSSSSKASMAEFTSTREEKVFRLSDLSDLSAGVLREGRTSSINLCRRLNNPRLWRQQAAAAAAATCLRLIKLGAGPTFNIWSRRDKASCQLDPSA